MRKLLVTLALAGILSVPSVVFAEATWYGSLRGGLQAGGGADGQFFDGGSRWGIKGSAEVSDGLTAVYRFEHKISTADGGQPGGRLAYAGLSGGFGTISVGQIWNAAYNHVGVITDKSFYFGDAGTGYRHGNAISYAFSSGAVGFQLDLISDGGKDSGKAMDKTEFGVTIGLGEIGKVAIAHTSMQDYPVTSSVFDPGSLPSLTPGTPPSLTPGTPPSLTPGTPPSLTAGTPPSLTPGSPTEVTVTDGRPNVPTMQDHRETDVTPTDFNLAIGEDGTLMVHADTRWSTGGTGATKYMTGELIPDSTMHKATIVLNGGALGPPATDGTTRTIDLMPVKIVAPANTVADSLTVIASTYTLQDDGVTYRANACDASGTTCVDPVAAFLGTYRDAGGTPVLDQETGASIIPLSYRIITADSTDTNVSHTAKVNVPHGITEGTAGTPTSVTVNPGTAPTLDAGTGPTLDAGTGPTLDAGTGPTLDPGSEPTLNAGTLPGYVDETTTMYGHKVTHVAVEFGLGGVTPYVGYSERKENNETAKSKTMHYGFSGSLGDTGMGYLVAGRNVKAAGGGKTSPWLINVWKDLGGGATVIFGHGNADDGNSGKSRVGLHVTF